MGQFLRMRVYPPVDFKSVDAPNADTLYTSKRAGRLRPGFESFSGKLALPR